MCKKYITPSVFWLLMLQQNNTEKQKPTQCEKNNQKIWGWHIWLQPSFCGFLKAFCLVWNQKSKNKTNNPTIHPICWQKSGGCENRGFLFFFFSSEPCVFCEKRHQKSRISWVLLKTLKCHGNSLGFSHGDLPESFVWSLFVLRLSWFSRNNLGILHCFFCGNPQTTPMCLGCSMVDGVVVSARKQAGKTHVLHSFFVFAWLSGTFWQRKVAHAGICDNIYIYL